MHQYGIGLPKDLHLAKRYYDQVVAAGGTGVVPAYLALWGLWLQSTWEWAVALWENGDPSLLTSLSWWRVQQTALWSTVIEPWLRSWDNTALVFFSALLIMLVFTRVTVGVLCCLNPFTWRRRKNRSAEGDASQAAADRIRLEDFELNVQRRRPPAADGVEVVDEQIVDMPHAPAADQEDAVPRERRPHHHAEGDVE
eukprot:EC799697.1.p1 GENE.EC799697.1~~EC799697.1.p1  ORF type:complete len:197 (+),score=58.79 EC799697.1:37-627(+)